MAGTTHCCNADRLASQSNDAVTDAPSAGALHEPGGRADANDLPRRRSRRRPGITVCNRDRESGFPKCLPLPETAIGDLSGERPAFGCVLGSSARAVQDACLPAFFVFYNLNPRRAHCMLVIASCHRSIPGRELSFVPDAAHECAVGCHAATFVAGIRASAWRQWGSARPRFNLKRTAGAEPT